MNHEQAMRLNESLERIANAQEKQEDSMNDIAEVLIDLRNQIKRQVWLEERRIDWHDPTFARQIGIKR